MRTAAAVITVLLASAARAQSPSLEPAPSDKPAAAPPMSGPVGPSVSAPSAPPGSAPSAGYEPGVGLRYKTPRTLVAVYGILEPTVSTVNNANAAGARQTGYQVSWFSGNRWGVTGSQSLVTDDALKAIFRLESEFELPTGDMDTAGTIFNRDCWAGLDGVLGKLTFGRQNTLPRDFSQNYGDPYGTANVTLEEGGWTNVNNFKQLIFFAGSATGTRYDSGAVWKRNFGEHVVGGLGYQFGNTAGNFSQNSTGAAALAFSFAPVNVSAYINEANNHGNNQRSYSMGGNYQLWLFRLNAGYFRYEADQGALGRRTDDAYTASVKVAPIAERFEVDAGYQRIHATNAAYSASSGNTLNQFSDTSKSTTTGSGSKPTVYGSVIYRFNRLTQVYVAFDHAWVTGGYRAGGATAGTLTTDGSSISKQTEIATGMRLIF